MPTPKLDLYGSTLVVGVTGNRFDRAIRRGIIRDLAHTGVASVDNQKLLDAARSAANEAGAWHHAISNLPLQRVHATRFAPTKALVTLEYFRTRVSVPTSAAQTLAIFDIGHRSIAWYHQPFDEENAPAFDGWGQPAGIVIFNGYPYLDVDSPPQWWMWDQAAIKIMVPTVLNFNPTNQVAYRVNRINDDTILFGGFSIPPLTLRFDAARVRPVAQNGLVTFFVHYEFTAVNGGWFREAAFFDQEFEPPSWQFPRGPEHPSVSFTTPPFPYHTPPPGGG